jgi:hypothetical protein
MEDDEVAESEAMFANDATEMNASPSSGSEAPESALEQAEANGIKSEHRHSYQYCTHGKKRKKSPP